MIKVTNPSMKGGHEEFTEEVIVEAKKMFELSYDEKFLREMVYLGCCRFSEMMHKNDDKEKDHLRQSCLWNAVDWAELSYYGCYPMDEITGEVQDD